MVTLHTHPQSQPARRARPGQGLLSLAAVGVSGLGLSTLYSFTGLGLGCTMRALTGWDCPFCGGTRMGSALLHADPVAAFWFNPAAAVGLVVATVLGGWLIVELLTGHRGRLARQLSAPLRRHGLRPARVALVGSLVLMVTWTLFRNLVLGPLP